METQSDSDPPILELAFQLVALDRRDPNTIEHIRLLVDKVMATDLPPEQVESVETDYPTPTHIVIALGKSLNYLANGPGEAAEIAGWMNAGVAAAIITAAHETTRQEVVADEERLRLQHALTTFAGLRRTLR